MPAVVVSPFVSAGKPCSFELNHTSILRFLGERFGDGGGYSPEVDNREMIHSLAEVLDCEQPRQVVPAAPAASVIPTDPPYVRGFKAQTENVRAFQDAAHEMISKYPHELASKFPEHRDFLGI